MSPSRKAATLFAVAWMLSPLADAAPVQTQSQTPSEVMVVGTLHRFHAKSPTYTYDMLYALVRAAKPDFVGVEIRPEDMGREQAYLSANYPAEMIETAQQWGGRAFGFDWLGSEIAGRPVPPDWWSKDCPVKQLERAMNADTALQASEGAKAVEALQGRQMEIVKTATPASLNDGRYDAARDAFYEANAKLLAGTKYQAVSDFYAERDRHIAGNVAEFVKAHPGKRIVILTGADHRGPLVRYLAGTLGPSVRLLPVP